MYIFVQPCIFRYNPVIKCIPVILLKYKNTWISPTLVYKHEIIVSQSLNNNNNTCNNIPPHTLLRDQLLRLVKLSEDHGLPCRAVCGIPNVLLGVNCCDS